MTLKRKRIIFDGGTFYGCGAVSATWYVVTFSSLYILNFERAKFLVCLLDSLTQLRNSALQRTRCGPAQRSYLQCWTTWRAYRRFKRIHGNSSAALPTDVEELCGIYWDDLRACVQVSNIKNSTPPFPWFKHKNFLNLFKLLLLQEIAYETGAIRSTFIDAKREQESSRLSQPTHTN